MKQCEEHKLYGVKGEIDKGTNPYCFKNNRKLKDIHQAGKCPKYKTKYLKTSFGKRDRRHSGGKFR